MTGEEAEDGSWTKAGSLFNRMARRVSEFNWSAVGGPEVSAPAVELKEYDRRVFEVVVRLAEQIGAYRRRKGAFARNLSANAKAVEAERAGRWAR